MSDDYRRSHLAKGADYDRDISDGSFNSFMTEREAVLLPRLVSGLFPDGVPKYLDFACGTGRITSIVEPLARESRGVDVSASMVSEAARKCPRTKFVIRDITSQALDESDFAMVTAFRFFGNAQDDLRRAVFRAVSRHLAMGGYFVFNNHRNAGSWRAALQRAAGRYEDHADLDLAKLTALMAPAGLRIERTVGIGWWQLAHRFDTPTAFRSPLARLVEPLSTLNVVAPHCPAYIVLARKVSEPPGH
ncbi:MAG: class I SAM-dependent methyltransferase [Vicinamibacterales bacterium]